MIRFASAALLLATVQTLVSPATLAQGTSDFSTRTQSDQGGTGREFGRPGVQAAHAGAGTTNGSTTGYSGPESGTSGPKGLPPLPSPSLCEPYANTPAHQACLSVVLRR